MVQRLTAQRYTVEPAADAATGADMALNSPPAVLIADLWMPHISGVQLCRLLRAEPATAEVPIILRGAKEDPRSRFWAERAGATAYVRQGRMGELVRALERTVHGAASDGFFMQLAGDGVDVRDRIAQHLDAALFESVIAGEVRALASAGSFDRLFDLFCQFSAQVLSYRWLAVYLADKEQFALHCHPHHAAEAEAEARSVLKLSDATTCLRIVDEDAAAGPTGSAPIVCSVPFGNQSIGTLALAPHADAEPDTRSLTQLVAREIGGPLRIAELMEESQRMAAIDPLTGLTNRRAFLAEMVVELARSRRYDVRLSMVLLDVDHFKAVNDTHGHAAGDAVLKRLGHLLRHELRITDACARWGGEEFVVALKNTGLADAELAAQRLLECVRRMEVSTGGQILRITASLGVATFDGQGSVDALIDHADRAMYSAKVGGRDRVVTYEHDADEPARTAVAAGGEEPALVGGTA
jgi:two-component system cell cycle response regulator